MREFIVNFHGVGEPPVGTDPAELVYWWDETPFKTALDQIRSMVSETGSAIGITFDDGNASDARIAMPALLKRGLTARFFVCAGRVGLDNYMDRTAIADLLAAGLSVGGHGMNHVDWRQISDRELDMEIPEAIDKLTQICDHAVDEVAIPFGSYDRRSIRKLKRQNLRAVYTSDGGYASDANWLKTRNTLDRSWQNRDFLTELMRRNNLLKRMRRKLAISYKLMR